MRLRILIKTPNGLASGVVEKRKFAVLRNLLGFKKGKDTIKVNKANNKILWIVDADAKTCMKISRNVNMYDVIIKGIFKNKLMQRTLKKRFTKEQQDEVDTMLKTMTKISIVSDENVEAA